MEHTVSGIGVLDKSVALIEAVQGGATTLSALSQVTGISRATAHRLLLGLVAHGLLRRIDERHFALGFRLVAFGRAAEVSQGLVEVAEEILDELRDITGESAQLYLRDGDHRVCVALSESTHGLRTIVSVGAVLPIEKGSAGHVLLGQTGRSGWVESVAEREVGVASVSAPVVGAAGEIVAAIGVSGPIERTTRNPGKRYGAAVVKSAQRLSLLLGPAEDPISTT